MDSWPLLQGATRGRSNHVIHLYVCQWYMNLTVYNSSPEEKVLPLNVNVWIMYFYVYFWHLSMFIMRYFYEYTRLLLGYYWHGWLTGLYFYSNMILGGLIWTAALWWLVSLINPLIEDLLASIKIVNLKAFIEEKCQLLCHCSFYHLWILHLKNIVSWLFFVLGCWSDRTTLRINQSIKNNQHFNRS